MGGEEKKPVEGEKEKAENERHTIMGDMTPLTGGFGDTGETIRKVMDVTVARTVERGTSMPEKDEDGVFRPINDQKKPKAK